MLRSLMLLLLVISMLLVACGKDKDDDTPNDTSDDTQQEETTPTETLVAPPPSSADTTPSNTVPQTETVWVVSSDEPVDVYDCPETTCEVVDTLFPGTALEVVSTEDDWHEIIIDDSVTAYIEVAMTQQEERLLPPENSSLPPGVTPSEGTTTFNGPPSLSAPPGQPTFSGTASFPTDGPPSNASPPPGVQSATITPNANSDGPPNVTSEPPPGVSD